MTPVILRCVGLWLLGLSLLAPGVLPPPAAADSGGTQPDAASTPGFAFLDVAWVRATTGTPVSLTSPTFTRF